jgi:hypothetical protein
MSNLQKNTPEYEGMVTSIATYLNKKGYAHIRADLAEFERPSRLLKKGSEDAYIPDLTAQKNNGTCYFEIVNTSEEQKLRTVGKWQLLSMLAQSQNGKFFVLVPHGKMSYANRLLADHNISAEVVKMQALQ